MYRHFFSEYACRSSKLYILVDHWSLYLGIRFHQSALPALAQAHSLVTVDLTHAGHTPAFPLKRVAKLSKRYSLPNIKAMIGLHLNMLRAGEVEGSGLCVFQELRYLLLEKRSDPSLPPLYQANLLSFLWSFL